MRDFDIIEKLVGKGVTEEQLKNVDCYVQKKLGLFVPFLDGCGYAQREGHTHPSYMVVIYFFNQKGERSNYGGAVYSPYVPHNDDENINYYCLMIDKDFFESQFLLYSDEIPKFVCKKFEICSDILKTLNTFAFEYSKNVANSEITLDAQATVIVHWVIRSILGNLIDMRGVSSDYSIARAQQFIEKHFSEKITVSDLAGLGYMSTSSFNRKFKAETGKTPLEYLISVRIERSKIFLRRKNISVTDIAEMCGFNSASHFSSCFMKCMGITPSMYQATYID